MLPEDPVVLFVHADRVVDHPRLAVLGRERGVEVADLADAVAAERERLRHAAEAPLPRVERVLPAVHRARIAVRDHHLADRRAVQDRPQASVVVVVRDLVQHETLERVERDAELPLLPLHEVAVDREARAFGLRDRDRLQVGAHPRLVLREVAGAVRRKGRDAVVDHLEHFVAPVVEVHDETLDRARVAVVVVALAQERDAARDAAAFLALVPEHAGRPRVDLHPVDHVGRDPAARERGEDTRDAGASSSPRFRPRA